MQTIDEYIRSRPESLTMARAESFLPTWSICEEWQRKSDAGELPEGLLGMRGMLETIWPDAKPNEDEARWILGLQEYGSIRWLADTVTYGDDNQIVGMHLIEASEAAIARATKGAGS